jgi:hypothetical protein
MFLEDYSIDEWLRPPGLSFNRWLPDGRKDAIRFPTKDKRNSLEIWLDRTGYVDEKGFIRHDPKRTEVAVEVMARQARLEASPLRGEATLGTVSQSEMKAVREKSIGSREYIQVAERILDFVVPPLSTFLDLVRTQYGQYWIRELHPWDSRNESIGNYCRSLSLRWRESPDGEWQDFVPDKAVVTLTGSVPSFDQFLTEADWRTIQDTCATQPEGPSLAIRIAARAHRLHVDGSINEAFIQAVTAIELALEEFLKSKTPESSAVRALVLGDQFMNLPLRTKVALVSSAAGLLSPSTLDDVLQGIDLRNRVVHEGQSILANMKLFRSLIQCVKAFTGVPALRMPPLVTGNA